MSEAARSHPTFRVADIMQRKLVFLRPDEPARKAARTLYESGISGAPVVEDGEVMGVISTSDLVRIVAYGPEAELPPEVRTGDGPPPEPTVRDVMMPARFSIRSSATIPELAEFLLRAGISRALVREGGRVVGIVSTTDVLRAVAGHFHVGPRA